MKDHAIKYKYIFLVRLSSEVVTRVSGSDPILGHPTTLSYNNTSSIERFCDWSFLETKFYTGATPRL